MKFTWLLVFSCAVVSCGRTNDNAGFSSANRGEFGDHEGNTVLGNRSRGSNRSADVSIDESGRYPVRPNSEMTPGQLCDHANEYRYPEKIKYCNRDVSTGLKVDIFVEYDNKLGYHTREMDRMAFKIDHLIPLCMGGSNQRENLWPQHKTIYDLTDPIEPYLCDKMSSGRIKQADAVKIILEVKQAPETTDARMQQLDRQ